MVAAAVGVGRPDRFIVGPDAPPNDGKRVVRGMMSEIPKANDQMGVMCPTWLRKTQRLEIANKCFDVLSGQVQPINFSRKTPIVNLSSFG